MKEFSLPPFIKKNFKTGSIIKALTKVERSTYSFLLVNIIIRSVKKGGVSGTRTTVVGFSGNFYAFCIVFRGSFLKHKLFLTCVFKLSLLTCTDNKSLFEKSSKSKEMNFFYRPTNKKGRI